MNYGEKIKKARIQKGYSQQKLADEVEVNKSTISRWENGKFEPTLSEVQKLSEVLEKNWRYFASDEWIEALNTEEVVYLPILGNITSISPLITTENISRYMKRMREIVPAGTNFVVVAEDDAVVPKGSEIMMSECEEPEDGELVAVIFELGEKPLVRRVNHLDDTYAFIPINPRYPTILKHKEDVHILGKAKRLIVDF